MVLPIAPILFHGIEPGHWIICDATPADGHVDAIVHATAIRTTPPLTTDRQSATSCIPMACADRCHRGGRRQRPSASRWPRQPLEGRAITSVTTLQYVRITAPDIN
ncbi:unnamed protein product [Prorocentrum cordatum]|uniref:Uncharacterized protein n=1 Tax=Prorocentrum cordatum TaxID=2364126 RepID=A0ABN9XQC8_9DINO|nr:unnamed protein product [Polarella glacialis]